MVNALASRSQFDIADDELNQLDGSQSRHLPGSHNTSVTQDRHTVSNVHHFIQTVRNEHHGNISTPKSVHHLEEPASFRLWHRCRRFVEDDDVQFVQVDAVQSTRHSYAHTFRHRQISHRRPDVE